MTVYRNRCGKFQINVRDPHPMWVEITDPEDADEGFPRHVTSADLYDLKHLVDRAIEAVEATERETARMLRE